MKVKKINYELINHAKICQKLWKCLINIKTMRPKI